MQVKCDSSQRTLQNFAYSNSGKINWAQKVLRVVQYRRTDTTGTGWLFSSHDPYDSYYSNGSWNNGSQVVQLVNCISSGRLRVHTEVHDPYDSYDSYGLWNNHHESFNWWIIYHKGDFRVYTEVHDPQDSYDSYGSWNNGSRVVHLVNCISLGRLWVYS